MSFLRPKPAEKSFQRIIEPVGHPLFQRYDSIIRYRYILRANGRTAFGDIAIAYAIGFS
jgi:hypothetical protein